MSKCKVFSNSLHCSKPCVVLYFGELEDNWRGTSYPLENIYPLTVLGLRMINLKNSDSSSNLNFTDKKIEVSQGKQFIQGNGTGEHKS